MQAPPLQVHASSKPFAAIFVPSTRHTLAHNSDPIVRQEKCRAFIIFPDGMPEIAQNRDSNMTNEEIGKTMILSAYCCFEMVRQWASLHQIGRYFPVFRLEPFSGAKFLRPGVYLSKNGFWRDLLQINNGRGMLRCWHVVWCGACRNRR